MSAAPAPSQIALFGGAFDPPHLRHAALVRQAIEQLRLDLCVLVPTGQAWHKARPLSPAAHRLAMTRLAFAEFDRVRVDDVELRRSGPSYTVDTVAHLRGQYPLATLHLLMGMDQWLSFKSWKDWTGLLAQVKPVVLRRPGSASMPPGMDLPEPMWLNLPPEPMSSTAIREHIRQHTRPHLRPEGEAFDALKNWLHADVARYISQHQLYSETQHP